MFFPAVFLSLVLVNEKLSKSVPVAVSLGEKFDDHWPYTYISFSWVFVEGTVYKGYEFPLEMMQGLSLIGIVLLYTTKPLKKF